MPTPPPPPGNKLAAIGTPPAASPPQDTTPGAGSSATHPAGSRKRPYSDEQLNNNSWLRRVWAKARDQELRANERNAKLGEENKAAKEQIQTSDAAMKEQAGALATLRQDLATSKAQIQAADSSMKKQAKAAGTNDTLMKDFNIVREKLDRCRAELASTKEDAKNLSSELSDCRDEIAAATEKAADQERCANERNTKLRAAKEQIMAADTAAKEHAEAEAQAKATALLRHDVAAVKLREYLARTCEELAASRAQLASANEGAEAFWCFLAAAETAQADVQAQAQAQPQAEATTQLGSDVAACRAELVWEELSRVTGWLSACRAELDAAKAQDTETKTQAAQAEGALRQELELTKTEMGELRHELALSREEAQAADTAAKQHTEAAVKLQEDLALSVQLALQLSHAGMRAKAQATELKQELKLTKTEMSSAHRKVEEDRVFKLGLLRQMLAREGTAAPSI